MSSLDERFITSLSSRKKGVVVRITGLSGAGKTSIAQALFEYWKTQSPNVVLIDGDRFRECIGDELGHSKEERLINAFRIARFAKFLSDQGIHVICATISLFRECEEWYWENLSDYYEVFLDVSLNVLRLRDPHGLYARAEKGLEKNVVGIDLPFDRPLRPHLALGNDENIFPIQDFLVQIIEGISNRVACDIEVSQS
ncbi:MAG: adenylyl-sulfate kinase [Nitrospirales bacterium]